MAWMALQKYIYFKCNLAVGNQKVLIGLYLLILFFKIRRYPVSYMETKCFAGVEKVECAPVQYVYKTWWYQHLIFLYFFFSFFKRKFEIS